MKHIPLHSLVMLIGPSKGGKSYIANKYFEDYEVISADDIKIELVGDVTRQDVNREVGTELTRRAKLKIKLGERVVVDANNLRAKERGFISKIGEGAGVPIFYVICDRPLTDKKKDGQTHFEKIGIKKQDEIFKENEREIIRGDGVAEVIDTRQIDFSVAEKLPKGDILSTIKKRKFKGITVIADVHGMRYSLKSAVNWATSRSHFMLFLGDVIDYGPKSLECLEDVYDIVMAGNGAMVYGNHERKIDRWFDQDKKGNITLNLSSGNRVTIDALKKLTYQQRQQFETKYKGLMKMARHHFVTDNILFTHAAGHPDMWNKEENRLKDRKLSTMAMFGVINPEKTNFKDGSPNMIYDWCDDIPKGKICVVGHDIRSTGAPKTVKGTKGGTTIFLDTGSGKIGGLTSGDIRFKGNESLKISSFNRH